MAREKRFEVRLDEGELKALDELVVRLGAPARSQVVRVALAELWKRTPPLVEECDECYAVRYGDRVEHQPECSKNPDGPRDASVFT